MAVERGADKAGLAKADHAASSRRDPMCNSGSPQAGEAFPGGNPRGFRSVSEGMTP